MSLLCFFLFLNCIFSVSLGMLLLHSQQCLRTPCLNARSALVIWSYSQSTFPKTPECRCLWASASFWFHFLASAVSQQFLTSSSSGGAGCLSG